MAYKASCRRRGRTQRAFPWSARADRFDAICLIFEIMMRQRSKADPDSAQAGETSGAVGAGESPRRPEARGGGSRTKPGRNWFSEPKSAVWMVLAAVVIIGGGRRLRWALRARKAVARLGEPDVTPEQIEAVAAVRSVRVPGSCSGSSARPNPSHGGWPPGGR